MRLTALVLLFLSLFPTYSQKTTPVTNPIYLATVLVDDVSEKSMAETCRYYHLTESTPENGFQVFTASDGTKLRFKLDESSKDSKPVVEIITKEKESNIKKILTQTGFSKTSDGYAKGSQYFNRVTHCSLFSKNKNILIFTKQ